MQAPSKFCCQNKNCPDYGKRGAKNLTVCGWYGKNNHIRLLYCRTCVVAGRMSDLSGFSIVIEHKEISLMRVFTPSLRS